MSRPNQTKRKTTTRKATVSGRTAAKHLFASFMSTMTELRSEADTFVRRLTRFEKSYNRKPHQGKREKARRAQQLRDGKIYNCVGGNQYA